MMANRARDSLAQAERDLLHAEESHRGGRHEWACFASHQAAEKAVKGLHLHFGQEGWGHVVAKLFDELPRSAKPSQDLIERGRVLDNLYIPSRVSQCPSGRGALRAPWPPCKAKRCCAMPVRALRSSVLRWPNEAEVDRAVRQWAAAAG